MITGFKEVFDAIKAKKELKQLRYSFLDSSLNDILFAVPTYLEAQKINSLISRNPEAINFLMIETINQYVLRDIDKDWLFGNAPAGLLASTFKGIVSSSFPKDANVVSKKLELYRSNQHVFDSIIELLTCELNVDISSIQDMTLDQIINLLAIGEKNLLSNERLTEQLEISGPSYQEPNMYINTIESIYRKHGISDEYSGLILTNYTMADKFEYIKQAGEQTRHKQRTYIDFDKENKELERALGPDDNSDIIRDDLDPYKTLFIKGKENEVKFR